jgi:hypothetical protein
MDIAYRLLGLGTWALALLLVLWLPDTLDPGAGEETFTLVLGAITLLFVAGLGLLFRGRAFGKRRGW